MGFLFSRIPEEMYLSAGSIALSTHVIHYSPIINWETHRATFNQRKVTEDTVKRIQ